jgi:hypothetical protein
MLRLAQITTSAHERLNWINRAIATFPDLRPENDSFPPPLIETFNRRRSQILGPASTFRPFDHFPDHRYLLLNGKRFIINPDLRLRLPQGRFRVTVLSDSHGARTEVLSSSQLLSFRWAAPPLADGTCTEPRAKEPPASLDGFTVLYSNDCLRPRTRKGWSGIENDAVDFQLAHPAGKMLSLESPNAQVAPSRNKWLWTGLSVLAVGAAYVAYREATREPGEWVFGQF